MRAQPVAATRCDHEDIPPGYGPSSRSICSGSISSPASRMTTRPLAGLMGGATPPVNVRVSVTGDAKPAPRRLRP